MSARPIRSLLPLLCALSLLALPALAQDGTTEAAPTLTEPKDSKGVATGVSDIWDPEKDGIYDTGKNYVYFTMYADPADNVDRDVYRFPLPAVGSAVADADYQRVTAHWGVDAFGRVTGDGSLMVYCSDRDRFQDATNPFYWDFELYLKNFTTGELKRLTKTFNDRELAPSVSDDGSRVVYMSDRFAETTMSLYWMDTSKPWERHLLSSNIDKKTFAIISPDGKHVYYNELDGPAGDPASAYDIVRIELDTLKKENLTNTKGIAELHCDIGSDNRTIVFERHKRKPEPVDPDMKAEDPNHPNQLFEIYMMDVQTKKLTQLTKNDVGDGFPSISADGKTVVFQSARRNLDKQPGNEFELFAYDIASGTEWQISSRKQSHDFVCAGF